MAFNYDKLMKLKRDYPKPKFAYNEVSRQLKKRKTDPYLLALQFELSLQLGVKSNDSLNAEAQVREIVDRKPPILDVQLLSYVYQLQLRAKRRESPTEQERSAIHQSAGEPILAAWKTAAPSLPNRKARLDLWNRLFITALESDCWEDVRFALNQASQEGLKSHKRVQFALIFANAMIFEAYHDSSKDADQSTPQAAEVSKRMAFMLLKRAFDNAAKSTKESVQVEDSRDLLFMYQILKQQDKHSDLITLWLQAPPPLKKILEDHVNVEQSIADMYRKVEDWQGLGDFSINAVPGIKDIDHQDLEAFARQNWKLLHYIILAAQKSPTFRDEAIKKLRELINHIFSGDEPPRKRPLQLTQLEISNFVKSPLIQLCKSYWLKSRQISACFRDLRRFVEQLERDDQENFHEFITETTNAMLPDKETEDESLHQAWYQAEVNVLKFTYFLTLSIPTTPQAPESFIQNAIRLYTIGRKLKDDSVQDVTHIIIMALLVRSYHMVEAQPAPKALNSRFYLQAVVLSWHFTSGEEGRQNRLLLLLSTFLHLNQGFVSIAFDQYRHARIKEMLKDTLSYILLSRISHLHPFETARTVEPDAELSSVIGTIQRMENKVDDFLYQDMQDFLYDQAPELVEMKKNLRSSVTKHLYCIERRRIARLKGQKVDESLSLDEDACQRFSDNRDFDVLPNFECSTTSMSKYITPNNGPYGAPSSRWLLRHYRLHEWASHIIYNETSNDEALRSHATVALNSNSSNDDYEPESTKAENDLDPLWRITYDIATIIVLDADTLGEAPDPSKLPGLLKSLSKYILDSKAAVTESLNLFRGSNAPAPEDQLIPFAESQMHFFWGSIEVLQLIYRLCDYLDDHRKQKASSVRQYIEPSVPNNVRKGAEAWFTAIQTWVKVVTELWRQDGVKFLKAQIRWGETGEALKQIITDADLDYYTREYVKSGLDTLNGLTKAKLKR